MKELKQKLIAAFLAAGVSASAAFVAYDLTLPSEGLEQTVYKDPVGLPTVCVGRMDKVLRKGATYSTDECLQMFAEDWNKHEAQLDKIARDKNIKFKSDWQRAALTDFTFNVGVGSVQGSTLIRLLAQGNHTKACSELNKWVYAGKQKLDGLVTRRQNTLPFCLGEIPWNKQKAYEQFLKEWQDAEMAQRLEKNPKNL